MTRIKFLTFTILAFFGIIVLGLFYTQVLQNNTYRELSERNRIRVVPLEAPRGRIYDRNGRLIVNNRISFDIQIVYQEVKDAPRAAEELDKILKVGKQVILSKIEKARKMPFAPVKIAEDVEKDKAIQIEEAAAGLPGIIVTTKPLRNYVYKNTFSHITGYLGEISEEELKRYKTYGYRMSDFVGKDGVERSYNDYLKGKDGGLQIEVDSKGRQLRNLAVKEPEAGKDIYLNADADLQEFCDSLLGTKAGVIIAADPRTGAVFALVSHPDFDPSVFIKTDNVKEVTHLLTDSENHPLMDRAISGMYPPGSVFKLVIMTAGLDTGKFNDSMNLSCGGSFHLGKAVFHCWKEEGHGSQDIKTALKNSCNVFFYQLGILVGPDEIAKYAFKLGFGRPTGIDLPGEAAGLVPSPDWKRKKMNAAWFKGETANYAIGQGYLLVTPIQVLRLTAAIANGGKLVDPLVVGRIENIKLPEPQAKDIGLRDKTLDSLKSASRMVVNERHGTGFYARSKDIVISGKTGTAENPQGASHAWFAGFAPFDDPKIAVVVFVEHGGKGGLDPAKYAVKIIEKARELNVF